MENKALNNVIPNIFMLGIDGCGGYLKDASSGTIMSPNYPSNYPDESNCIWFIEAPKNYSLVLNITAGISGESNCDDFLRVSSTSCLHIMCLNVKYLI